ncbi:hypothetical protein KGV52_00835, partial [Candidatus Gracilibacteria bacterium]|nr:hypothetical protein [Candidatus Gracilibacteria bacterium]
MDTIKKILGEYTKNVGKMKVFFLVISALFLSGLTIIEPLFFAQVVKFFENAMKGGNFDMQGLLWLFGAWGIFSVVYIGFSYFYRYYMVDVNALKNHNMFFVDRIGGVLKMKYGDYLGKKTGSIYKNFDRGNG